MCNEVNFSKKQFLIPSVFILLLMNVWECSTIVKEAVSFYQVFFNHAGDKDLKKILEALIDLDIPVGARITDPEK